MVANHHNSLVDPLLLLATLGVRPRFLAKSTLWELPRIRSLLDLAGAVPVYRRQDEGVDPAQNDETFARCFDELAAGGAVALFPEGISHDAPGLAPLKTGAARIVLGAMRERARDRDPILPVGLTFDEKGIFRSRVLVRIGEPLEPTHWLRAARARPARGRAFAHRRRSPRALARVTLNYPSHEEASLLERASELFAAREQELPARLALAEAFALRRAAIALYERLRARDPERARGRARTPRAPTQRASRRSACATTTWRRAIRASEVLAYAVGSAALLLWWLPLAALGTLFNWIPYRLLGRRGGPRPEPGPARHASSCSAASSCSRSPGSPGRAGGAQLRRRRGLRHAVPRTGHGLVRDALPGALRALLRRRHRLPAREAPAPRVAELRASARRCTAR